MKPPRYLVLIGMFIFSNSHATVNTLTLIDSYPTQGGKVCVYSDGHRAESIVNKGAGSCPSKKIFR
ncbi:hypothetical protein DVQ18_13740 [Yersinia enterocolitica]|uniref:Secreted protein n=1 Tax=Yersinia enterocolitica TaxID=630 RepID=A0A9P1V0L7_YEREN|nr:hypothetical protein FORC2_0484 [Yersinia enterocolitica]ALG46767.1 hypothetical protein LI89_19195 [Yersinia enterocolitica]EKN5137534.1 hypothetical protein [Yersinia enterocolitica]EKN6105049.1 hypothetical protein [Yersinia enterocolitica]EKN6369898.1 hypothetical protein [Yersinia enterocolitica]